MRNYKKLAIIVSGVLAASAANAAEQGSINKELSETRANISAQILQNKLFDAELEGLKKQQEIKEIRNALEGNVNVPVVTKETTQKINTFQFDEELNNEDILSVDNEWEQNVGFIYQDTLDISGSTTASPIGSLTETSTSADDSLLSDMLASAIEDAEAEAATEGETEEFVQTNVFKLTAIDINKLVVKDEYKSAELKVSYITDNGFQKIRGAKITKAEIGKIFDVKGEESFKVKNISKQGVTLVNLKNNKEIFVSK